MAGIGLEMNVEGIRAADLFIGGLTRWDLADLAFNIGAILESSTKRRIAEEKTAPDGTPWVPWSEAYDETREPYHSLLVNEGNLRDSIANTSRGLAAIVGSNLIYAAHQHEGSEGDGGIPSRPFLGVSDEDEREIRALIIGEVEDMLP